LNYYVYQTTPFDFSQVGVLHADLAEVTTNVGSFIVTAKGTDQVGVVAALATSLANLGVAIDNIEQQIDGDKFRIEIEAHVATDDSTMEDIQEAMKRLSESMGIEADAFYPETGE
ncbi:MAG: ACT domain-containing protein, partial [Coriobacteriaceae bacterium]|nr:ACT domain-containing protein [Coriobacteriaceae bacterium]